MGIIIDTNAEEVAQPNLQPTCNQLATDCISRQAAIDILYDFAGCIVDTPNGDYHKAYKAYRHRLEILPSAQPERPKGEWTATYSDCGGDVWVSWKCSNCGYVRKKGWEHTDAGEKPDALFCEMCNADMRGEKND